jgi:hypothetical protein
MIRTKFARLALIAPVLRMMLPAGIRLKMALRRAALEQLPVSRPAQLMKLHTVMSAYLKVALLVILAIGPFVLISTQAIWMLLGNRVLFVELTPHASIRNLSEAQQD